MKAVTDPTDDASSSDISPTNGSATNGGAPNGTTNGAAAMAIGAYKRARRLAILVIGVTVILIGVAMIVTPGPAVVVIPIGLAILASEFYWAKRLLVRFRKKYRSAKEKFGKKEKAPIS